MPLFIPNRTSSPFFSQQRRRNLSGLKEHKNEQVKPEGDPNALRLYPLESEYIPTHTGRKIRPVNPLSHPNRQHGQQGHGHGAPMHGQQGSATHRPHGAPQAARNPIGQTLPPQAAHGAGPRAAHGAMQQSAGAMPYPAAPPMQPQNAAHMPAAPANPPQASQDHAVAQFRRANKGLPDGVRYEPLDDNTMRLLREHGHLPAAEPTVPAQHNPAAAPVPVPHNPTAPPSSHMPNNQALPPAMMADPPTAQPTVSPWQASAITEPPSPQNTWQSPTPPAADTQERQNIISIIENLIQDERNAQIFYSHLATTATAQATESAISDIAGDCANHAQQFTQLLLNQFGRGFAPVEAEINTGLRFADALSLALVEENRSLRVLAELLEQIDNAASEKIIQRVINKKIVNYNQLTRFYT